MSATRPETPEEGATVADAMLAAPKVCGAEVTVAEVRTLLTDHHVHAALVVGPDQRLLAVVEPGDLVGLADDLTDDPTAAGGVTGPGSAPAGGRPAVQLGRLAGRVVAPTDDLAAAWSRMEAEGRRRLAVVDDGGRLVGLLCLKRSGSGFCSADDVAARAADPR